MNKIKLSVVIPIYNVEEYIKECMDSILSYTGGDIEIICVDDSSIDSSYDLVLGYQQCDDRIKIHKNCENKGLSYTRNVGLENSCGDYVWFVDSDDKVCCDAIKNLLAILKKCKPDVLMFDIGVFRDGKGKDISYNKKQYGIYHLHSVSGREIFTEFVEKGVWDHVVYRRCYRRRFLIDNRLFFDDRIIHEDILHSFKAILKAKNVMSVNQILYDYRIRQGSIKTRTDINSYRVQSFCIILNEIAKSIQEICDYPLLKICELFFVQVMSHVAGTVKKMDSIDLDWGDDNPLFKRYFNYSMAGVYNGCFSMLLSSEYMNRIRKAEYVVIYGAGQVGTGLYELLIDRNVRVDCFAETSISKEQTVLGNKIYNISDVPFPKSSTVVLVMVRSRGLQKEMKAEAINKGYRRQNILTYEEIHNQK